MWFISWPQCLVGLPVKALAVLTGEMPDIKQLNVHSPLLSSFRNNLIYKRIWNHNCQPRCHCHFRMSRNKGILYPLFLEHYRCQIMHRVPSWRWVCVSLEATEHWFQKDIAFGGVLTWISSWKSGRKHGPPSPAAFWWSSRQQGIEVQEMVGGLG